MASKSQGWLFRIRLGEDWLSLWLFGILPVAGIRLHKVLGVEQRGLAEFWRLKPRRFLRPDRYWLWPSSPGSVKPRAGTFVVRTASGRFIWMRLRAGLHYQLREAIHQSRTRAS